MRSTLESLAIVAVLMAGCAARSGAPGSALSAADAPVATSAEGPPAASRLPDWEGVYRGGVPDMLNMRLVVSRESGATLEVDGCFTRLSAKGTVAEAVDHLRIDLVPERASFLPPGAYGWQRIHPVVWGRAHFLIPEGEMAQFCADAQKPDRAAVRSYLRREGDGFADLAGLPTVPIQFFYLLAPRPAS